MATDSINAVAIEIREGMGTFRRQKWECLDTNWMWEIRDREELWIILRFPGEQVNVSILNRDGHFF